MVIYIFLFGQFIVLISVASYYLSTIFRSTSLYSKQNFSVKLNAKQNKTALSKTV